MTSELAGLQASLVFSIVAANVLLTALAFYLFFHESLTIKHLFGMVFIVSAIVMIAYGN